MLGLIYEEIGQVPKALKLFMMAAHLSKRDVTSWRNLAALCKKHGESQQCIYCLQRVLAITPDDKDAQWERAMLLSELGEHRKAAKAMLPLLRAHPDNADLVRRLVRSYHRLGYTGKAIYLLDELVIFFIAVAKLRIEKFQEGQARALKLVGGVVMIALAIVLVADPDIMSQAGPAIGVFVLAFAVSGLIILVHRKLLPRLNAASDDRGA